MNGRTYSLISQHTGKMSPFILPQPLLAKFGEHQRLASIISRKSSNGVHSSIHQRKRSFKIITYPENKRCGNLSRLLQPVSQQYTNTASVASSGITSYQQKEMPKLQDDPQMGRNTVGGQKVAMEIVKGQLADMVNDIHRELDAELLSDSELAQLAKYVQ